MGPISSKMDSLDETLVGLGTQITEGFSHQAEIFSEKLEPMKEDIDTHSKKITQIFVDKEKLGERITRVEERVRQ